MNHLLMLVKKYKTYLIIGLILSAGFVWYIGRDARTITTVSVPKMGTVERGDLRVSVSGSGQVVARSQVDLTPVIAGEGIDVVSVQVNNNQRVKKGQTILILDTKDAMLDIQAAELALKSARIKKDQTNHQFRSGSRTDQLNRSLQKVAVEQQASALYRSQLKLADYTIRAPFDGIVTGLDVEAGDSVSRDTVIASVITPEMRVAVTLNEVDAIQVKDTAVAYLTLDALPGETIAGTVTKIATIGKITQNIVSYEAEIELDEQMPSLKPGMSVSADIAVAEKRQVLLVPNAALTHENGRVTVQKVSATRKSSNSTQSDTEATEVSIGLTNGIKTEIISGLSEGDRVITQATTVTKNATAGSGNIFNSLFRGSSRGGR